MTDEERFLDECGELIRNRLSEAEKKAKYWRDITPEEVLTEARKSEDYESIEKIAKLTGLKLREVKDNDYGLIIDKDHELFGQIGVYNHLKPSSGKNFYKFGKKIRGFNEDQVFLTGNIEDLLEKKDRLGELF